MPNYISDDEMSNDEEDAEIATEIPPRYITRQQSKIINGNITKDVMLMVMEMNSWQPSAKQMSTRKFPLQLLCEFANAIMDEETGDMLEYRHLVKIPKYQDILSKAFGKEIGQLAQGQPGVVEGTNTLFFVPFSKVPKNKQKNITYAWICTDYRPEKKDPNQCRISLGGNVINYSGDVGTRAANMLTIKLLLNMLFPCQGQSSSPWTSEIFLHHDTDGELRVHEHEPQ